MYRIGNNYWRSQISQFKLVSYIICNNIMDIFRLCHLGSMETIHDRQWRSEPDTASVTSTALVIDCKTKQILKIHISDNSLRFGVIEHETTKQPQTTELKQFHLHSLNLLTHDNSMDQTSLSRNTHFHLTGNWAWIYAREKTQKHKETCIKDQHMVK